ncbi:MAG: hypothetical protein IKC09_05160 [Oscillospiraceae bacterium]|nr:hypothetical protein [Oscillospiraceae bacterium]
MERIGGDAFCDCTSLEIVVPGSGIIIGREAFSGCLKVLRY